MALLHFVMSFLLLFLIPSAFCNNDLFCSTIISPTDNKVGSYFGVAVLLRNQGRVTVGAPRANSSLDKDIYQPGTAFDCHVDSAQCREYKFGPKGNYFMNNTDIPYGRIHHRKDDGWLGAALDGSDSYNGQLVVCSPRWINQYYFSEAPQKVQTFSLKGLCYFLKNSSNVTDTAELLIPLREGTANYKEITFSDGTKRWIWNYNLGEAGMAVHFVQNPYSVEIMIGAPGLRDWKGGVAKYIIPMNNKFQIFEEFKLPEYSYFGYSMASGEFVKGKRMYVSGAPRAHLYGLVVVYEAQKVLLERFRLKGHMNERTFEYFGAALAVGDVTGDGLDDILVGAPMHSFKNKADAGSVYLYISGGKMGREMFYGSNLTSPKQGGARFGTAVAFLGDINSDGYGDMAIGAPYWNGGKGAIFLYFGWQRGLKNNYITILGEKYDPHLRGFGISISRGLDVDANNINDKNYPNIIILNIFVTDLAVGAYLSGHVVILKTRPIVIVKSKFIPNKNYFNIDTKSIIIKYCLNISGKHLPKSIKLKRTVYFKDERIKFMDGTSKWANEKNINPREDDCFDLSIHVQNNVPDNLRSLYIYMNYTILGENGYKCDVSLPLEADRAEPEPLEITYQYGCANPVCLPDLHVNSTWAPGATPLALGRNHSATLQLKVANSGEFAYNCWLRVSLPACLSLVQNHLHNCHETAPDEPCLIVANPLRTNNESLVFLVFNVDLTKIKYDEDIEVKLKVTSEGGKENVMALKLPLERDDANFTFSSKSSPVSLVLKDKSDSTQLTHTYQIVNKGYSPLDSFSLDIQIPLNIIEIMVKILDKDNVIDISNNCSVKNKEVDQIIEPPDAENDIFYDRRECSYSNRIYRDTKIIVNVTMIANIEKLMTHLHKGEQTRSLISTRVTISEMSGQTSTEIIQIQHTNLILWLLVGLAVGMLFLIILIFTLFKCGFFKTSYARLKEETLQAQLHHKEEEEDQQEDN